MTEANGSNPQATGPATNTVDRKLFELMQQRFDDKALSNVEWMVMKPGSPEGQQKMLAMLGYMAHQLHEIRKLLEQQNKG